MIEKIKIHRKAEERRGGGAGKGNLLLHERMGGSLVHLLLALFTRSIHPFDVC